MRCCVLASLAALFLADVRTSTCRAQAKITTDLDVMYAKAGDKELKLDLARPAEGKGPYPCVVMFHGGAWQVGSRKELSVGGKDKNGKRAPSVIEAVAARGYVDEVRPAITASTPLLRRL